MDEHTSCPLCRHDNPPENRFCGRCGAPLTSGKQLVPRREGVLATASRTLPTKFKPVGKALAVTLVALTAEVGLTWLGRRAERNASPGLPSRDAGPGRRGRLVGLSLEEAFIQLQEGDFRSREFARRVIRSFDIAEPTERYR